MPNKRTTIVNDLAVKSVARQIHENRNAFERDSIALRAKFEADGLELGEASNARNNALWEDLYVLSGEDPAGFFELDFTYFDEHDFVFLIEVDQDPVEAQRAMMEKAALGRADH